MYKLQFLIIALLASLLEADCFNATDDLTENAQKIRLVSKDLGWEVGTVKSLSVAGVIRGKRELYPDGNIKLCIKEVDGDLKFIMYSNSEEASEAKWYFLTASKTGWF